MKETPILFSAPMVRAILAGSKTQTRRAWRVQPPPGVAVGYVPGQTKTPYGGAGDRLWVRETWAYCIHAMASHRDEDGPFVYAADGEPARQMRLCDRWRPSIHMPRAASRITLEITGVRVERLQAISHEDARAEGSPCYVCGGPLNGRSEDDCDCFHRHATPNDYRGLWESINGAGSWDANPWVWCIDFRRL